MSSFECERCGKEIHDTPHGYITGCEHYPLPRKGKPDNGLTRFDKLRKAHRNILKEADLPKMERVFEAEQAVVKVAKEFRASWNQGLFAEKLFKAVDNLLKLESK